MDYPFVHQLGFVVRDMEKAMEEYGKIYHIKKWYRAAKRNMACAVNTGRAHNKK